MVPSPVSSNRYFWDELSEFANENMTGPRKFVKDVLPGLAGFCITVVPLYMIINYTVNKATNYTLMTWSPKWMNKVKPMTDAPRIGQRVRVVIEDGYYLRPGTVTKLRGKNQVYVKLDGGSEIYKAFGSLQAMGAMGWMDGFVKFLISVALTIWLCSLLF